MPNFASTLCKLLVMALFFGCPLLAHFFLLDQDAVLLRTVLLVLPLAVVAGWAVLRATNKLLCFAVVVAAAGVIHVIEQHSYAGLVITYGLPHTAAYVFLIWLFGRTLAEGREPLITRLARRVHGSLASFMEVYTRRVTVAWCVFCAAQLGMSVALLIFASLEKWSLFVNILNAPLVVLMFVGEYIYRVMRFPDYPHASIVQALREFAKDGVPSDAETR